ncbi:Hsp20/alpha crystallin family protein [Xanthobacter autotrophicus DSM 597]|jgi:HSP20 family protein|uniref:Hsp20/alpha crystallin family protein n=1 Tax=Xanthobacter wiegelii TaxID=3119913 RepID=UPI0037275B46
MRITDLIPWRTSRRDVAVRTEPADPIRAFRQDIDRAFENFWRIMPSLLPALSQSEFADTVRVDVSDSGKEVTVTAELPGLTEDDVSVSIVDGELTIRGEKRTDRQSEDDGLIVRERAYGAFERTLPLPVGVDPDAAGATFKNGLLTVVLPKTAEALANVKRIPVQAG